MEVQTIKTGKCPVCGSSEVYDSSGKNLVGDRKFMVISSAKRFTIEEYVCLACGYFKEFISDGDLKNEKILTKVRENWNKTDSKTNAG